ncbi:MAG: serine/threonine protein phosphatase [Corynebacterium sp.]|uniref:metallophosphoesterase n=1 Tax=Corynebacterium sp. TaxID=1720 RepID=UPI0026DB39BC|nr:metallophosphoesterase [Corynebacterium sp.]MDO5098112.1 serine/threonine protein phosphatase [Corynebacterium sp.]
MHDFYISDPHFGHQLVSRLRGFDDPKAHDRFLYNAWLEALPANAEIRLWILGDNYCGSPKAEDAALATLYKFREEMSNRKNSYLELHGILGNHDSAHPLSSKSYKQLPRYLKTYDSVQIAATTRMAGATVMLSHFPYDGDHHDSDRVEQFRLRDLGQPIIHGHTHSAEQLSWSKRGSLQVCVCVEACPNSAPISKTELEQIVKFHHHPRRK